MDLNAILNSATSLQHAHIVSFSDHRADVKNELQHSEQVAGVRVGFLSVIKLCFHYLICSRMTIFDLEKK